MKEKSHVSTIVIALYMNGADTCMAGFISAVVVVTGWKGECDDSHRHVIPLISSA